MTPATPLCGTAFLYACLLACLLVTYPLLCAHPQKTQPPRRAGCLQCPLHIFAGNTVCVPPSLVQCLPIFISNMAAATIFDYKDEIFLRFAAFFAITWLASFKVGAGGSVLWGGGAGRGTQGVWVGAAWQQ